MIRMSKILQIYKNLFGNVKPIFCSWLLINVHFSMSENNK